MMGVSTLSLCGAADQSQDFMLDGQALTARLLAAILFLFICLSVFGCFAYMCVTTCIPGDLKGQKRVSNPLGLEFQTVENCCVFPGT